MMLELLKAHCQNSENGKLKNAYERKNIIILGDFNYHMKHETKYIYQNDFSDLWLEKVARNQNEANFDENGYTWDGQTNSMINRILPFDNRRMRLDRIICKNDAQNIKFEDMRIFANQKMPGQ